MKCTIFILAVVLLASCVPSEQEEEDFIDVSGNKIHTKTVGTGQPMILAHGGYLNLDMWGPQVDAFRKTNTLIRFSDLGHGASIASGNKVFGYEIIGKLAEANSDQKIILVGLSWGAMLCVDYTLHYPHKVEKLILFQSRNDIPNYVQSLVGKLVEPGC